MKINDTPAQKRPEPATSNAGRDVARQPAAPAAPAAGLSMSPLASQIRDIGTRATGAANGDIDVKKVEEIRQAIADGTLKMDSSKIADGLLATLRELSGGKGG